MKPRSMRAQRRGRTARAGRRRRLAPLFLAALGFVWVGQAAAAGGLDRWWEWVTGRTPAPVAAPAPAPVARPSPAAAQPAEAPAPEPAAAKATPSPRAAPEIPVAKPTVQAVTDYTIVTGTVASANIVKIIARVEGYLDKIHFADGALVKKDDLLFTVQQAQYKAQLQQAQAQLLAQEAALAYAKTEVVRYTALYNKHAATATEVDKWVYQKAAAEAGILGAQGQVEVSKLNLDYTEVRAPFDGLMGKHLVDPGNVVGGGGQQTALAEITQLDPIYVTATLSEQQVLDIRANVGQHRFSPAELLKIPLDVGLENATSFPYHGFIEFVAPQFDPTTGTLQIRGVFDNPDRNLLPGLFVRMRVPAGHKVQGAVLAPARAIGEDQGGQYLMLVNKDDVVEQRYVKAAEQVGDLRVITSGLSPDDLIVVGDLWRVSPGLKVVPKLTSPDAQ